MFVNRIYPGKSENELCESWKTLEFRLCKSWKVLENSLLLSVRTLNSVKALKATSSEGTYLNWFT